MKVRWRCYDKCDGSLQQSNILVSGCLDDGGMIDFKAKCSDCGSEAIVEITVEIKQNNSKNNGV
jgi:hypothetical protein